MASSRLKIWLTNGEVHTYEFEPRADGQWSTASRLGKIFEARFLRVHVGDSLIVFPVSSVLRAELTPAPKDLSDPVAVPVEED